MARRILIVDGMNIFIRSFVCVPTTDTDGNSIGGVTGFLRSLKMLVKDWSPDRIIVAWDGAGGSRMRRGIFSEYKAGRKVRLNRPQELETQDESFANMGEQMEKLKKLLDLIGVIQIVTPEVEADDVIALLCKYVYLDEPKLVVTSDKDMLQLIDDKTVVYSPTKKQYWTKQFMLDETHVLPENFVFVKALMGDGSDNIPGVGGIGTKTAIKLFPFLGERETTAEEILQHATTNSGVGSKYKSLLESKERFLENIRLMQLSNPIIDAGSTRTIRISALDQKPKFNFTSFKMSLAMLGIQQIDVDFIGVFQLYQHRADNNP